MVDYARPEGKQNIEFRGNEVGSSSGVSHGETSFTAPDSEHYLVQNQSQPASTVRRRVGLTVSSDLERMDSEVSGNE